MGDLEYKGRTPQERQQEMRTAISEGRKDATTILPISVSGNWNDESSENIPNAVHMTCWYNEWVCHEAVSQIMKGGDSKRIWFNDINYLEVETWNREKIVATSPGNCFKREITIDRIAATVTSRAEFIGNPELCGKLMDTKPRINRLGNYPKSLDAILNH